MRASFLACLFLLCDVGCRADSPAQDASTTDAVSADSGPSDASGPDAFTPCPGLAPFEAGLQDWSSESNIAGATVTDIASARSTSSAPNGRATVCLDRGSDSRIAIAKTGYLDHEHHTKADSAETFYESGQALTIRLLSPTAADDFYIGVGLARDEEATTLIVHVHDLSSGDPVEDAVVAPDNDFVTSYAFELQSPMPSIATGADGRLVFTNVDVASGTLTLSIPADCTAPANATVISGGVTSVFVGC